MGYFYHRFASDSLNKLYELLENVTPLEGDCGALCCSFCCKGGDGDGMLLFPGEKSFYEGKEGFSVWRHAEYDSDCVVCPGSCRRDERPLSCRVYPYFFYVNEAGDVAVAPDVRAMGNCPLAGNGLAVSPRFLRAMRMCAEVIRQDPELFDFVRNLSGLFVDFGPLV